jgi:hypothetical protein
VAADTSADVLLVLAMSGAPGLSGRFALAGKGDLGGMTLPFTMVGLRAPAGWAAVLTSSPSAADRLRLEPFRVSKASSYSDSMSLADAAAKGSKWSRLAEA